MPARTSNTASSPGPTPVPQTTEMMPSQAVYCPPIPAKILSRIQFLEDIKDAYPPDMQRNMDAVIKYYQHGGEPPATGIVVFPVDGVAIRGTLEQYGEEKNRTGKYMHHWVEMSISQVSCWLAQPSSSHLERYVNLSFRFCLVNDQPVCHEMRSGCHLEDYLILTTSLAPHRLQGPAKFPACRSGSPKYRVEAAEQYPRPPGGRHHRIHNDGAEA